MPECSSKVGRTFEVRLGAPYFPGEDPLVLTFAWTVGANDAYAKAIEYPQGRPVVDAQKMQELMWATCTGWNITGDGAAVTYSRQEALSRLVPLAIAELRELFSIEASALRDLGNLSGSG